MILLRLETPRALPVPDFAGGYDQQLLRDVERLTSADVPGALQPALVLAREIDKAGEPSESGK